MILEGIVTTLDANDALNVAPMGPIVDDTFSTLLLRPFPTSRTYQNLKQRGYGVLHVIDDVLLIARAAIGQLDELPPTIPATQIPGRVLADACRWYEFEVVSLDESQERMHIQARVLHVGRLRDFWGFNRAKHAVIEAAILATRKHLIPAEDIRQQIEWLRIPVTKTAGPPEAAAFALICQYLGIPNEAV